MARFDGSAFTREQGYEGPGEGVGCRIVPASFYGPGVFATQDRLGACGRLGRPSRAPRAQRALLRLSAGRANARSIPRKYAGSQTRYTRTPGRAARCRRWSRAGSNPRSRALSTSGSCRRKSSTSRPPRRSSAPGGRVWFYNHGRPNGPALVIDAPPTDGRVVGWAAFKHHLDGYFFWHGVHWQHNSQKQGERRQNVWANPITFDNRGQPNKADFGFINGDGVLMYPGEDVLHPDEDRGIAGPVGTLQLANFRRGLQDYEYLAIARRLGLEALVDESRGGRRAARVLGRWRRASALPRTVTSSSGRAGTSDAPIAAKTASKVA